MNKPIYELINELPYELINELAKKYNLDITLTSASDFSEIRAAYEELRRVIDYGEERRRLNKAFDKYVNETLNVGKKQEEVSKSDLIDALEPPKPSLSQKQSYKDDQEMYRILDKGRKNAEQEFKPENVRVYSGAKKKRKFGLTKKVIAVASAIAIVATSAFIVGYKYAVEKMDNNIFVVYRVKSGDTTDKLDEMFYRYDVVNRASHAPGSDYALYAGDEVLGLTSDEKLEEIRQENIPDGVHVARDKVIKSWLDEGKLWHTKRAVQNWMEGKGPVDYVVADQNSKKM